MEYNPKGAGYNTFIEDDDSLSVLMEAGLIEKVEDIMEGLT